MLAIEQYSLAEKERREFEFKNMGCVSEMDRELINSSNEVIVEGSCACEIFLICGVQED